jgi:hypothetical protein
MLVEAAVVGTPECVHALLPGGPERRRRAADTAAPQLARRGCGHVRVDRFGEQRREYEQLEQRRRCVAQGEAGLLRERASGGLDDVVSGR